MIVTFFRLASGAVVAVKGDKQILFSPQKSRDMTRKQRLSVAAKFDECPQVEPVNPALIGATLFDIIPADSTPPVGGFSPAITSRPAAVVASILIH